MGLHPPAGYRPFQSEKPAWNLVSLVLDLQRQNALELSCRASILVSLRGPVAAAASEKETTGVT